jgi:polyphosphate kinase 2 (PPK2 family)
MQYFIGFFLTLFISFPIIFIMKKKISKKMSRTLYSQKDTHELFKYFFAIDSSNQKKRLSQLTKHTEKSMIKVMVIGQEAYWVSDNTFYVAKAIDGEVEAGSATPVDVENMSKNDMNKMLFILDNLQNGNKNDSGSAGNERI